MKLKYILTLFIVPACVGISSSQAGLHIAKTFHIKSDGGWDYLEVGPVHDWLYVSHNTHVNILNKNTGDSVSVIEGTTGVHGIAFDVENGKGYISNGRLNNVFVFDLNTNKVLGEIATGENPDAIMYEPFTKTIITCNGRSHDLSIIDPVQEKVVHTIDVGGKPEKAASDGDGILFVNIENKNEIVKVDLKENKVLSHWNIMPGENPTGLIYDRKTNRLFAGCDRLLMVIDATTGRIIDKLPIGAGCDGVAFDPTTNYIYTSNGEGTLTVIHEDDADKFTVIENVATKRGARTIALDEQSHLLYLPTADFGTPVDGERRPPMIHGSFQVLVVGK